MKSSSLSGGLFASLDPKSSEFAVEVVNTLLPLAIQKQASDIHIQPRPEGWEVLLRIDGILSPIDWIPRGGATDPVTRLMVLAGLPTYQSGKPMEGRLKWEPVQDKNVMSDLSLRLGVFPTVYGVRAVIRLLRQSLTHDTIDSLGLSEAVTSQLHSLTKQSDGAILTTGPAGSGKTTTMYAMLRGIASNEPRRSVMTIEDPVECVIETISQSELDASSGLTLASALRSAVRQDSEVMLVSEVRDPETSEAVVQASMTGHLVFSSLHATDIASALRRLEQFGVPQYAIHSGVRAIVSQRLLRRICDACNGEESKRQTCETCLKTGYRGRVAIAQCVCFDGSDSAGSAMITALGEGHPASYLRKVASDAGGSDLNAQAMKLVDEGVTSASEAYRVLGKR